MIEHPRHLEDGEEGRGSVNTVVRQGEEIHRPLGDWSPAVHGLLQYLSKAGFTFSPKVLGVDEAAMKERLSYIHGQVAKRPWPQCLLAQTGLEQIGRMLRGLHNTLADYRPSENHKWRDPSAIWHEGMIIRHGDLGPWNMVWESGKLVGLIDWDLAVPGEPLEDLAQVAWYCVPLRPREGCEEAGVDSRHIVDRLKCLCFSYGVDPDSVIEALIALEQREIGDTERLAAHGIEPWVGFQQRGDINDIKQELRWLCNATESAQREARVDALTRATQL